MNVQVLPPSTPGAAIEERVVPWSFCILAASCIPLLCSILQCVRCHFISSLSSEELGVLEERG